MWVRGLKLLRIRCGLRYIVVAPYVGAWIETRLERLRVHRQTVAPYVGAWIETCFHFE